MSVVTDRAVGDASVRVIDDALPPSLIAMIHRIAQLLPLTRDEAANADDAYNLMLKHEFDIDRMAANPALGVLLKTVLAASDELFGAGRFRLFRAHLNDQTYGDFQHAHPDVRSGVTALYYANPEWREDWHGETLFYDSTGEPVSAVAPRPGRITLFPGGLVHRGGMPSRLFMGARLTIAFKFERADRSK